jgi:adenine-specific DNA methylase
MPIAAVRTSSPTGPSILRAIPSKTVLETNPPAAFASKLALREGNSKKPIYQIHKWWARRLGSVFRSILLAATAPTSRSPRFGEFVFYKKHDLTGLVVLDPFVGGGTTLVEAAKCNASVIGVDIDPVACFVTSKELHAVNETALTKAFEQVASECKQKLLNMYRTVLPDGIPGVIVYAFWVDIVRCRQCRVATEAHPHYQLSRDQRNARQIVFCSHCGHVAELSLRRKEFVCTKCNHSTKINEGPVARGKFTCPHCHHRENLHTLGNGKRPPKQRMFALEVLPDGKTESVFKKADAADHGLFAAARRAWKERKRHDRFTPKEAIPVRDRVDRRPLSYGYRKYSDLFNDRQLFCLSTLAQAITHVKDVEYREFLATAFSDSLAANNMFCFYAFDYQKLTPLFGLHAYHKVNRPVENNVWGVDLGRGSFTKCFQKLLRAKRYGAAPYEYKYGSPSEGPDQVLTGESIKTVLRKSVPKNPKRKEPFGILLNQSSEKLHQISDGSIDLILSDPPYYDNLAYSELSDFYHVWLKRLHLPSYKGNSRPRTPMKESLYVRNSRDSEHVRFVNGLAQVMSECHRVLKENGLFVFTFHHKNWSAWSALGSALFRADFDITNVFPVRSEGRSQFHSAAGNLKWDAVFCCRKRQLSVLKPLNTERARAAAMDGVSEWEVNLQRSRLKLGRFDRESLRRAFFVKELLNCSSDPCTMDVPVFTRRKTRRIAILKH